MTVLSRRAAIKMVNIDGEKVLLPKNHRISGKYEINLRKKAAYLLSPKFHLMSFASDEINNE